MREEFEIYNFFKSPKELKKAAKEGIKGNSGRSLGINLILWLSKLCFFASITFITLILFNLNNYQFNLIMFITLALICLFIAIFTFGPLKISQCKHSINMVENSNPTFKDIAFGFKNNYLKHVGYGISIIFLYFLNLILLIVPFVKKYIDYQVSGFILAENLDSKVGEAFKMSRLLNKGHSKKFLNLFINFIPEFLLCLPTAYIYSLWLRPKYNAAVYCYYKDIKK